jgi:hypothetical protein
MSEKSPLINTTTQIYEFDELQLTSKIIFYRLNILDHFFKEPPTIVICKFCNEDCDEQEYDSHKVRGIKNKFFCIEINIYCSSKNVFII